MNRNQVKLPKDVTDRAIGEIQSYFLNEREEELGILSATLILDFITEKLGPAFYNQGLHDAIAYMNEKTEELYGLEK